MTRYAGSLTLGESEDHDLEIATGDLAIGFLHQIKSSLELVNYYDLFVHNVGSRPDDVLDVCTPLEVVVSTARKICRRS